MTYSLGQPKPSTFTPRSQRVSEHPPVGIERNHVRGMPQGRFPAVRTGHRQTCRHALRLRTSVSTPWNSASALSGVLLERFMRRRGIVHWGHVAARERRGPYFLGQHHPVENLAQALIRTVPGKNFHLVL